MSYYSIEEILSEEEKVPCVFQRPTTRLGFVDPSLDEDDIPVGSTVLLPWWLGRHLMTTGVVVLGTPRFLTARVRESLLADSRCVPLRDKCPYFYEMSFALSDL
eukprot:c10744_g1_i1.p1 GENE.c10744_g1_i1~~c10744_g1_i1.p1  ORF type:complete len:121 (+),score=20.20 c10744_g1_i1:53-364(+)